MPQRLSKHWFVCQRATKLFVNWRQDVDKVLAGLNAKEVAEQLSVLSALMRPSPAAMFNSELGELSNIRYDSALAAAAAEDAARKDNRDTRERAVNALVETTTGTKMTSQLHCNE